MARKEVWVWSGSSQEHHVVPGGNQARVVCSVPSPPTLHLFCSERGKGCWLAGVQFLFPLLLKFTSSASCTVRRRQTGAPACALRSTPILFFCLPLEICDFYSGSVVPKLDLVWRRIFIASGCEAVATPPCRAPHGLQCRRDEVPPGPLRRLIPFPLATASLAWVGAGQRALAPTVVASAGSPSFQCTPQLPRGLPSRGRAGRRPAGLVPS